MTRVATVVSPETSSDPLAGFDDDPLEGFDDDGFDSPDIVETEIADGESDDFSFSLDEGDDPLLNVLGGELEEFLEEPDQMMYHLRMATGDVVGPYMGDRVENMLRTGMLLGNEEISADGQTGSLWAPILSSQPSSMVATSRAQWTMRRSSQAAPPIKETCRSSWACKCASWTTAQRSR